jgi:hypothetical protein
MDLMQLLPYAVGTLFLRFLQQLPERLFSQQLSSKFLWVHGKNSITTKKERKKEEKNIMKKGRKSGRGKKEKKCCKKKCSSITSITRNKI